LTLALRILLPFPDPFWRLHYNQSFQQPRPGTPSCSPFFFLTSEHHDLPAVRPLFETLCPPPPLNVGPLSSLSSNPPEPTLDNKAGGFRSHRISPRCPHFFESSVYLLTRCFAVHVTFFTTSPLLSFLQFFKRHLPPFPCSRSPPLVAYRPLPLPLVHFLKSLLLVFLEFNFTRPTAITAIPFFPAYSILLDLLHPPPFRPSRRSHFFPRHVSPVVCRPVRNNFFFSPCGHPGPLDTSPSAPTVPFRLRDVWASCPAPLFPFSQILYQPLCALLVLPSSRVFRALIRRSWPLLVAVPSTLPRLP